MRSMESKLKWDASREERRHSTLELKNSIDAHREHSSALEVQLRDASAEVKRDARGADLQASKALQEFKVEARARSRVAERESEQHTFEAYQHNQARQQWMNANFDADTKDTQGFRRDLQVFVREEKAVHVVREKTTELEDREHERRWELARSTQEVVAEKERLLSSISHLGRCRDASPVSSAARHLTSAQVQRVAPPWRESRN